MKEQLNESARKVRILVDALPYIRDFSDKIVVLEYDCAEWLTGVQEQELMQDIILLKSIGMRPVVVHNTRMGMDKFRENKRIANLLEKFGCRAIGICGVDYRTLKITIENDYIPVIQPNDIDNEMELIDPKGTACEVAQHLKADKLIYLSNFPGIFTDETRTAVHKRITVQEARKFQLDRLFPAELDAMIGYCCAAVENGVHRSHILDARESHALLIELFSIVGAGTVIIEHADCLYEHEREQMSGIV